MIKNLWTIEYGCDWIVATQNHKGEGSAAVGVVLPRKPQRASQLESGCGVIIRIISWRTIYSSDFQIVFSHRLLLFFLNQAHIHNLCKFIFL